MRFIFKEVRLSILDLGEKQEIHGFCLDACLWASCKQLAGHCWNENRG